jgi:hypothetical protein
MVSPQLQKQWQLRPIQQSHTLMYNSLLFRESQGDGKEKTG